MTDNVNLGLQLLVVGMISVFFILGIVVVIGKLLITSVNKWSTKNHSGISDNHIDRKQIAVISAAVQTVTKGKGTVSSIKKI